MKKTNLPVGVESFEEIRKNGYYYVDKTMLIEEIVEGGPNRMLLTRPRLFGKTLNMSMLKSFFEIGADPSLFEGLYISKNTCLCDQYMGKYPVISISFKGVNAKSYPEAVHEITDIVNREVSRARSLIYEDQGFELLFNGSTSADSRLWLLSQFLKKHYQKNVIVLIDDYDVPLATAHKHGYYEKMAYFLYDLIGDVLNENESLKFAVLTGCLPLLNESSRFDHTIPYTVRSECFFEEVFGFTDKETKKMLQYYGLEDAYDKVREWYFGYHFGGKILYCPWDIVSYCADHHELTDTQCKNYWIDAIGNDMISQIVDQFWNQSWNWKLESLVNGEPLLLDSHNYFCRLYEEENFSEFLIMSGYLWQKDQIAFGWFGNFLATNLEIRSAIKDYVLQRSQREVWQNQELRNT